MLTRLGMAEAGEGGEAQVGTWRGSKMRGTGLDIAKHYPALVRRGGGVAGAAGLQRRSETRGAVGSQGERGGRWPHRASRIGTVVI